MKLFLDIDGVMVHANPQKSVALDLDGFYKFNVDAIETLNVLIHSHKITELILSTSHRFRFTIKQWEKIFSDRGIHIKKISVVDLPLDNKNTRKTEIITWIEKCDLNSNDIIILDDDKSLNGLPPELKKRLVLTNPYTGLNTDTGLNKIIPNEP